MHRRVELTFIKNIKGIEGKKKSISKEKTILKTVFKVRALMCETRFSKFRGLMFSKRKNLVFVFRKEQRVAIHMLFVFFPIEIFFLDSKKRVVEKAYLKPFTFYMPRNKVKFVIEISEDEDIKKTLDFQEGDRISFEHYQL